MTDTEREAFEAWAEKAGWPHTWRNCNSEDYKFSSTSWEPWQAATQRQQSSIAELEAEVQALRKDAERYRWLASVSESDGSGYWLAEICLKEGALPPSKQEVDAAIDAAMNKEGARE